MEPNPLTALQLYEKARARCAQASRCVCAVVGPGDADDARRRHGTQRLRGSGAGGGGRGRVGAGAAGAGVPGPGKPGRHGALQGRRGGPGRAGQGVGWGGNLLASEAAGRAWRGCCGLPVGDKRVDWGGGQWAEDWGKALQCAQAAAEHGCG